MFFKLFGPPDNDPNGAGYPSTTGNPSGGGRGNDDWDYGAEIRYMSLQLVGGDGESEPERNLETTEQK